MSKIRLIIEGSLGLALGAGPVGCLALSSINLATSAVLGPVDCTGLLRY